MPLYLPFPTSTKIRDESLFAAESCHTMRFLFVAVYVFCFLLSTILWRIKMNNEQQPKNARAQRFPP